LGLGRGLGEKHGLISKDWDYDGVEMVLRDRKQEE